MYVLDVGGPRPLLGALAGVATLTGTAQYFTGEVVESWRDYHPGGARCSVCEPDVAGNPDLYRVSPMRDKTGPNGEVVKWCRCQIKDTLSDLRPGVRGGLGDAGWALYVPDLIPTGGGSLPGFARLQGDVPALQSGSVVTLQGEWIGTPPNNLCTGCGWDFRVSAQAPAGTEGTTEVLQPEGPGMVEARLEILEETARIEAIEAGATEEEAEAVALLAVEEERELIRTGYVQEVEGVVPAAGDPGATFGAGMSPRILWGGLALLALLGLRR